MHNREDKCKGDKTTKTTTKNLLNFACDSSATIVYTFPYPTRCSVETVAGKKMSGKIDIEIKIETKAKKTANKSKLVTISQL